MSFPVGIGIITFNRKDILAATIERVRLLTREPDAALIVADDGSTDGTPDMLRAMRVPLVTGVNMGIAWNKNRALFVLSQVLGCETVILLEDDARPARLAWDSQWIAAARHWGHVNYAGDWMREYFLSGSGTADDPVRSTMVTAQCAAFSRAALSFGGYFDPRFTGYGHEHVEHTSRMIRLGYGGSKEQVDGTEHVLFHLITGGVTVVASISTGDAEAADRNLHLARMLMAEDGYRAPWRDDRQARQFRSEVESSFHAGRERFLVHGLRPIRP